jgi:uncharacterized protein (TIGR03382 family)
MGYVVRDRSPDPDSARQIPESNGFLRGESPGWESLPPCFSVITRFSFNDLRCKPAGTPLAHKLDIFNQPLLGRPNQMTTKTLLMFAATGLITPVALEGAAEAGGKVTTSTIVLRAQEDTAPVANGRLRRTNEEQPGNEMSTYTCKGTVCRYFSMTTELPPLTAGGPVRRATDRMQLSMTPFTLQLRADGSVEAVANPDPALQIFVTSNDGNEYRNANHPRAFLVDNGDVGAAAACVEYNYQPNNTNDTKRYLQCFNMDSGAVVLPQTQIFAKNNDDASMNASGRFGQITQWQGKIAQMVAWRGANGNGADDGWLQSHSIDTTNPAQFKFTNNFDISLCPREERSHGNCSVSAADPNTAICSWTEGNTQPQRDGTWLAAVDITPGKFSGANRQAALIWKEQVEGRKDIDGLRTYSMRAHHERILVSDATTGQLTHSDQILWYSNDLRGNNNTNEKGGTVHRINMAVMKVDKTGMSYVTPMTDMSSRLKGLGGTHLGMTAAVFGSADATKPGVMFTNGSHTGGYFAGQARSMSWDGLTFTDGGMTATAENDRHLYPNYLGNNPGNQGRNYTHAEILANPLVGQASSTGVINTDKFLMVIATTGKPMSEVGMPEYKATAFLTVIPVNSACGGGGGGGNGTGGGTGAGAPGCGGDDPVDPTEPVDPTDPTDPEGTDSGASLGGCSTGNSAGGFATMLLIGLALLIRRRRA